MTDLNIQLLIEASSVTGESFYNYGIILDIINLVQPSLLCHIISHDKVCMLSLVCPGKAFT